MTYTTLRHDWTAEEIAALYDLPFMKLVYQAQTVHRANHQIEHIEKAVLLNIKTGACPENCGYCSQSAHFDTGLEKEKLMPVSEVLDAAQKAKDAGAARFCMGAAWRSPPAAAMPALIEMIEGVNKLGLETCMTLGMLKEEQAQTLADAGLDYYNHNIDTSPEYYDKVVTTRTFDDRINTLNAARDAGMKLCTGGILGMGESRADRVSMLRTLSSLTPHPESVPINRLVPIDGTPLADAERINDEEWIRTIAVARIMMPTTTVRLAAGRHELDWAAQTLCFMAGANSVFYGERLLTTPNVAMEEDEKKVFKLKQVG
ncbi:biotin synthase [Formosimonas limnophila]|uniref:Biotin synthase n=1 Tax=Formosimonas limnophila TaxID=1384487 RepID=A0A8J3CM44_9BURK|nr:biotin synthase BioB [Formosimonas limnophila]GHA66807.1 biotin synthase [Formosimonas limnophila]